MRIAHVAPLAESVPPTLYGGTERVVSWLTEDLVQRGHDVTLFASGDSRTSAELIGVTKRALRLDPSVLDAAPYNCMLLDKVFARAREFDVIHFHIDLIHYPVFRAMANRVVTTLHGRLDLPDLHPFYRAFPDLPLVSISNAQRRPMPPVNWMATVHHGMPRDLYRANLKGGDYLAFLGRICPEKGIEDAIAIAERAGVMLKIAAKVDPADKAYFETVVRPLLASRYVDFVGEIDDRGKNAFLGGALAVLFPICWPEPFGLVMIEAMACGTPVIAYPQGSVPEILEHRVTGLLVNGIDQAVAAVEQAAALDRSRVRRRFEERFVVERMSTEYLNVYRRLVDLRTQRSQAA